MSNATLLIHYENKDVSVPVQYNPSEYSLAFSARYAEDESLAQPNEQEFIGEEMSTLTFSLTIDGFTLANTDSETEAADISEDVEKLRALTVINEKLHRPPECTFLWGSLQYRGVATSLSVRFTMFSGEGKPVRAAVDITLTQSATVQLAYESPDRSKRKVLAQDTELFMVAVEAYHDPAAWRPIAVANGIKNPRRVETGMTLRVPPLEEAL